MTYDNPDWQRDSILAYAHRRAQAIAVQRKGDKAAYIRVAAVVRAMELTPEEFREQMMQIANVMRG